jgi:hypothetical protein
MPAIPEHLNHIWEAFGELLTERFPDFGGYGPIPHSKIVECAARLDMGPDEAMRFRRTIRAMESIYNEEMARKLKGKTRS